MTRPIKASYGNTKFMTNLVALFEERDLNGFAALFSQNKTDFRLARDEKSPADYVVFSEFCENLSNSFDDEGMQALAIALTSITDLSVQTKVGAYLATFRGLSSTEREQVFGVSGPQAFRHELAAYADQAPMDLNDRRYSEAPLVLLSRKSVREGESPEDFLEKTKILEQMGIRHSYMASELKYKDSDGEQTAYNRYKKIIDEIPSDRVAQFLREVGHFAVSYEMVKAYGFEKMFPSMPNSSKDPDWTMDILLTAFRKNDIDLFKVMGSSPRITLNRERYLSELLDTLRSSIDPKVKLTDQQSEIMAYVSNLLNKETLKMFGFMVEKNQWGMPAFLMLDCVIAGDIDQIKTLLGDSDSSPYASFCAAVVCHLERIMPMLVEEGKMGEPQKAAALYLHERATRHLDRAFLRIQSIDTTKANSENVVKPARSRMHRGPWGDGGYEPSL
jgi:hypothetical protein